MQPSCFFFGDSLPSFPTEREREIFEIALIYQLEQIIMEGVYTFNSCMLPGIDLLCTSHIAGIINNYHKAINKEDVIPPEFSSLSIRLYKTPVPTRLNIDQPKSVKRIIQAASYIHRYSKAQEDGCVKRAIRASTHIFAVYPDLKPYYVYFAEKQGLKIIRFTPDEILSENPHPGCAWE